MENQRFEIFIRSCPTPIFRAGQLFKVEGRDILERYRRRLKREGAEYAVCSWGTKGSVCCIKDKQ